MALLLNVGAAWAEGNVLIPESPARAFARQLAGKDAELKTLGKYQPGEPQQGTAESPILLEEIRIYGQVDPEDYVKRKAAFVAFRERLERERPLTPKEKAQMALCIIGLCGIYGPDGIPKEDSVAQRNEARKTRSSAEIHRLFRGTLQ
jgi:hypothetical protein